MKIISRLEAMALGLKRYFTGKPCKHGHLNERYVSNSECCGCHKIRVDGRDRDRGAKLARIWRKNHPEQALRSKRRWRLNNRDKFLAANQRRDAKRRNAYRALKELGIDV